MSRQLEEYFSHNQRVLIATAWLFLILSNAAVCGFGQVSAAISGAARDSSGGALPGVAITIRNIETNAARHTISDGVGQYQVWALPVGDYEVAA